MRYQSFRLQITGNLSGGFTVYAQCPRGEGSAQFIQPFQPEEASALHASLWRSARNFTAEGGDTPPISPDTIGEHLFTALFAGEILRLYERSLDLLEADPNSGLRLELMLDPRDPNLAAFQAFPWELLRQPDTPEFPVLSRRQPLVRYLAVPKPVYAANRPAVLRILVVAANPRSGGLRGSLDIDRELHNLQQAVGSAPNLEIVTPQAPTLTSLRQALLDQECHVLHFIGHGGLEAENEERVLFFESGSGSADPVRGKDLLNKLTDFPTLRLAFLNACESGAVSAISAPPAFDPFAGVANSLVLGGLPAVIAMQFTVSDQAAIAFSRSFYQRLAQGDPVDAAVAEGRQAMHSANSAGFEWATPVLFMRTRSGELYPAKDISPEQTATSRRALGLAIVLGLTLLALPRLAPQVTHVPTKVPVKQRALSSLLGKPDVSSQHSSNLRNQLGPAQTPSPVTLKSAEKAQSSTQLRQKTSSGSKVLEGLETNKEESTPLRSIDAKLYQVNLLIPTQMSGSAVWLDGREARIIKRTEAVIIIEVPADSSNHQIRIEQDGLPTCETKVSFAKDGTTITPCQN